MHFLKECEFSFSNLSMYKKSAKFFDQFGPPSLYWLLLQAKCQPLWRAERIVYSTGSQRREKYLWPWFKGIYTFCNANTNLTAESKFWEFWGIWCVSCLCSLMWNIKEFAPREQLLCETTRKQSEVIFGKVAAPPS